MRLIARGAMCIGRFAVRAEARRSDNAYPEADLQSLQVLVYSGFFHAGNIFALDPRHVQHSLSCFRVFLSNISAKSIGGPRVISCGKMTIPWYGEMSKACRERMTSMASRFCRELLSFPGPTLQNLVRQHILFPNHIFSACHLSRLARVD